MSFEWNDYKNKANIEKHGISFEEAALIFKDDVLTKIDNRKNYGEIREVSTGTIRNKIIIIVVQTERNKATRIISARLANKEEKRAYYDYYKKKS